MPTDVTDLTFEEEVIARSDQVPVIVDLWAPWCGPCRTLGPILEKLVGEANGAVELVKVNVDDNPAISAAFQVQSIPAVYALSGRKVIDGFIGALPEAQVREFLDRLAGDGEGLVQEGAPDEVEQLLAAGDEHSLRHLLEHEPDHQAALEALAELLVEDGRLDEAQEVLSRATESEVTRRIAAKARVVASGTTDADLGAKLTSLLESVKTDDQARQEFIDILESLDAEDPRKATFRRALASRLY